MRGARLIKVFLALLPFGHKKLKLITPPPTQARTDAVIVIVRYFFPLKFYKGYNPDTATKTT